jgi:hypothetical protein
MSNEKRTPRPDLRLDGAFVLCHRPLCPGLAYVQRGPVGESRLLEGTSDVGTIILGGAASRPAVAKEAQGASPQQDPGVGLWDNVRSRSAIS